LTFGSDGDTASFGLLVDKYKASIYALAYSRLHNFHDAEDVTQDVFLKAYENLRSLRRWGRFHVQNCGGC
jgi:DNA-directed RNA polymerase specialized sigma24 family protein